MSRLKSRVSRSLKSPLRVFCQSAKMENIISARAIPPQPIRITNTMEYAVEVVTHSYSARSPIRWCHVGIRSRALYSSSSSFFYRTAEPARYLDIPYIPQSFQSDWEVRSFSTVNISYLPFRSSNGVPACRS